MKLECRAPPETEVWKLPEPAQEHLDNLPVWGGHPVPISPPHLGHNTPELLPKHLQRRLGGCSAGAPPASGAATSAGSSCLCL